MVQLAAVLLAAAIESMSPADVATAYLQALSRFDVDAMNQLRPQSGDGQTRTKDNREFERSAHTKWTWRIIGTHETAVHVLMTEANDYYDLLGVGRATQIAVYHIDNHRIRSVDVVYRTTATGDQSAAAARFRGWLLKQRNSVDPAVIRDGELEFDAHSAKPMIALLKRWVADGRP